MGLLRSQETSDLLSARWQSLPESLKLPNQVVGRFWVQCGFTLGSSYCSFGCSHCYLPANANRVPLVSLEEMKAQIDANRRVLGKGGHIQVTGGDLVDAYVKANKTDELIELIRYCVEQDLIPMLMTHGQGLLDNRGLLEALVQQGGLRKLSCHIDTTQAGRPGFPKKSIQYEHQLNPLRDQLVDLVLSVRKNTGKRLVAAQTVTVTSQNLHGIKDILDWLVRRPENMEVTRTMSFQTEAEVGRTLKAPTRVTADQVWQQICQSISLDLPREHLVYGHPECNSSATLLVRSRDRKMINLDSTSAAGRTCWQSFISRFGGLEVKGGQHCLNNIKKALVFLRHPWLLVRAGQFIIYLRREQGLDLGMLRSLINGSAKGVNIVMHNFIDERDIVGQRSEQVQQRLDACSFRGAVKRDGIWQSVSMCEVNAKDRPIQYNQKDKHKAVIDFDGLSKQPEHKPEQRVT